MNARHYDYLIHASVPNDQSWGLPLPNVEEGALALSELERALSSDDLYSQNSIDRIRERKIKNYELSILERKEKCLECSSLPPFVQISRMEKCNLSCRYCRPGEVDDRFEMDVDVWEETLERLLPTAVEFLPYCWGEPLLDPLLPKAASIARKYRTPISMISNLQDVSDSLLEWLPENVTRILVSVDVLDEDEFRWLRRGGTLPRVKNNIERLMAQKESNRSKAPWLGLSVVLMKRNLQQMTSLLKWAGDIGVEGICVRRLVVRDNIEGFGKDELVDLQSDEYKRVYERCLDVCSERNILLSMPDPQQKQVASVCPCPWSHVYISPRKEIHLCSYSHRRIAGRLPLDENFWNASPIVESRERFLKKERCEECASLDFIGLSSVSQIRGY